MANLIFDTCGKNYGTVQIPKLGWLGANMSVDDIHGAGSGKCLKFVRGGSALILPVAVTTRITFGMHYSLNQLGNVNMFIFGNSDCIQFSINVSTAGEISFWWGNATTPGGGAVMLTTSPSKIIPGITSRLEFEVVLATDATGSITIHQNEQLIGTRSGIRTSNGYNSTGTSCNIFQVSTPNPGDENYISNLYINDDQGATHTTFEGDVFNEVVTFNADGATQDFAKSDGAAPTYHSLIDLLVADATKYLSSSNSGDKCLFGIPAFSADVQSIHMLRTRAFVNKSGAGVQQMKAISKTGVAAIVEGTLVTLTDGDQFIMQEWDTNPGDGTSLTPENVAANLYGLEMI